MNGCSVLWNDDRGSVLNLLVLQHLLENPLIKIKYLKRHHWHFETLQQHKLHGQLNFCQSQIIYALFKKEGSLSTVTICGQRLDLFAEAEFTITDKIRW